MSTLFVFSNNASTLIASSILSTDTTVTCTATQGALFPSIAAGHTAPCTLEDVSGNIEVVYATGRTSDVLTITRAQEGTTALAFPAGSRLEQRVTAGVLSALLQKNGGDTLAGTTTLSGILTGGSVRPSETVGPLRGVAGQTSNQVNVPSSGGATASGSLILTAANVAANVPAGVDFVRTGMVVAWTGIIADIPSGWVICDGNNGTPNLTDQFIVGATVSSVLASTGTYSSTTGASSAGTPTIVSPTLASGNLPSHKHDNVIFAGNAGSVIGPAGTAAGGDYFTSGSGAGVAVNWSTGLTGASSPIAITANAMGTHTHSVSAPPYTAMFFIMKT
jgi:hypothetical protein